MTGRLLRAAAALALVAAAAAAQQAPPARFRGVIQSFDGTTLVVKTPDGKTASVTVPTDLRINANAPAKLSDIKAGDFIGSAADKGNDGFLHAEEVHIFPESMRGTGEGHRPMAQDPNRPPNQPPNQPGTAASVAARDPEARTMTTGMVSTRTFAGSVTPVAVGSITGASVGGGNVVLVVEYPGGAQTILVARDTPIVKIVPGDRSLLTPGAAVSVVALQKGGRLTATALTAEK